MVRWFFLLFLTSCSSWFIESEARLQLANHTDWPVRNLRLVGEGVADEVWIAETIAPGEQSQVYPKMWSGTFNWRLEVKDSRCGAEWCVYDLGSLNISGGSSWWAVKKLDSTYILTPK